MKNKLEKLSKENLQNIILKMRGFLSEEQCLKLEGMIDAFEAGGEESKEVQAVKRMSDELVNEKLKQLEEWMSQIEEGELYLNIDAYEDYSSGYWDSDWIIDYYDNQGIGDKISFAIQLAKDCVDDRRYQEANHIYEWLWDMAVWTDEEYDGESVDLETLVEKNMVHTDMKQLALLTLYTDYQALKPEMRAENIYLYFSFGAFRNIHIEEMFYVGRENLTGTEQFWEDWIALLQTKNGEVAALLAVVAEIKENMGVAGAKQGIFTEYKRKFPRHSSFQAEMKSYFDA